MLAVDSSRPSSQWCASASSEPIANQIFSALDQSVELPMIVLRASLWLLT